MKKVDRINKLNLSKFFYLDFYVKEYIEEIGEVSLVNKPIYLGYISFHLYEKKFLKQRLNTYHKSYTKKEKIRLEIINIINMVRIKENLNLSELDIKFYKLEKFDYLVDRYISVLLP